VTTAYQIQVLEKLYRHAVQLQVNPAGTGAPCEGGCGRLGHEAHHIVRRSQEPGIRWKYEPRWGVWLCHGCHIGAELDQEGLLAKMAVYRPERVKRLRRYLAMHDRVKCRTVTFGFMREYLRRQTALLGRKWAESYCMD